MPSTISKPTTKTIRVKQSLMHVSPEAVKNAPATVAGLRRRLKSLGAVRTTPQMKRRLVAASAWGMPNE